MAPSKTLLRVKATGREIEEFVARLSVADCCQIDRS